MKLLNYILSYLFVNKFNIFDIFAATLVVFLVFTHSWFWLIAAPVLGAISQIISNRLTDNS